MTLAAFMYGVCMILVWFLLYSRVILGYAFLSFLRKCTSFGGHQ